MSLNLVNSFAGLAPLLLLGTVIVNVIVALAVYKDAKEVQAADARALKIMNPAVWALFCLFGSIPAFALYWVAHHSTLAK